ncbi:MAG: EamA family transporter [Proteobacteria bacterium]|nr:EamA family transporter [Pseudomonadota bacterium]MBU1714684.1 EamA family transporter [Pseudomonadota bacterium]
MDNWFLASFLALIIYGFWGFFPKLAVTYINPQSALVYEIAGAALVGVVALFLVKFQPESHPRGIMFAVLTGVCGMVGTLFYFWAASKSKISIVVSVTALYPLITILLAAVFLKEPITVKQISGMLCALLAIFLLSS